VFDFKMLYCSIYICYLSQEIRLVYTGSWAEQTSFISFIKSPISGLIIIIIIVMSYFKNKIKRPANSSYKGTDYRVSQRKNINICKVKCPMFVHAYIQQKSWLRILIKYRFYWLKCCNMFVEKCQKQNHTQKFCGNFDLP